MCEKYGVCDTITPVDGRWFANNMRITNWYGNVAFNVRQEVNIKSVGFKFIFKNRKRIWKQEKTKKNVFCVRQQNTPYDKMYFSF